MERIRNESTSPCETCKARTILATTSGLSVQVGFLSHKPSTLHCGAHLAARTALPSRTTTLVPQATFWRPRQQTTSRNFNISQRRSLSSRIRRASLLLPLTRQRPSQVGSDSPRPRTRKRLGHRVPWFRRCTGVRHTKPTVFLGKPLRIRLRGPSQHGWAQDVRSRKRQNFSFWTLDKRK